MERKAAYRSHVRGSASDPVKGGGSKESLQDQTANDTIISNDETTDTIRIRRDRDELKEADLETENIWVRFWRKLTAYCHSLMEIWRKQTACRPSSHEEKELGIQDEENLKSKGTLPVINWSAGSKDSLQDQTKNDTYISNYDETTGHERDELMKEADLETGNKRVPTTFRRTKDMSVNGCVHQLGYDEYFRRRPGSSRVPNPGIKRPSIVIVSGPPPPPPPPTL